MTNPHYTPSSPPETRATYSTPKLEQHRTWKVATGLPHSIPIGPGKFWFDGKFWSDEDPWNYEN
jgi:hypothetical protein